MRLFSLQVSLVWILSAIAPDKRQRYALCMENKKCIVEYP